MVLGVAFWRSVGPSHNVFVTPRRVRFVETEFSIPRETLMDVIGELRAEQTVLNFRISSRKIRQSAVHVDADHVPARCEPHLALAGEQDVPGLVLLAADQGVLAVGAEPPVGSGLASGAG